MAAFSSSLTTALASPRGRGRGAGEEDMGSTYIKSKRRKDAKRQLDGRRKETESVRGRWRLQLQTMILLRPVCDVTAPETNANKTSHFKVKLQCALRLRFYSSKLRYVAFWFPEGDSERLQWFPDLFPYPTAWSIFIILNEVTIYN